MLARKHPLDLLEFVSMVIAETTPSPMIRLKRPELEVRSLDEIIFDQREVPGREVTAFLAIVAELVVDAELSAQCRRMVEARDDRLPAWISGLSRIHVYRTVRLSHVLGDVSQVLIGARLGGAEMTCVVDTYHNSDSCVTGATFVEETIEQVLEQSLDRDIRVFEMALADARAWVQQAVSGTHAARGDGPWPACRPLVQWLIGHMPEGGTGYRPSDWESAARDALLDEFFASTHGAYFADSEYRDILEELIETGAGDPLRWSARRVRWALEYPPSVGCYVSVECLLVVPDMLRAFIPFAHAKSRIREGLTTEALAVIDRMSLAYEQDVLREAGYYDADDEGA